VNLRARTSVSETRQWQVATVAALVVLWSSPAEAYRPFDGTDADVAGTGEFELELGPAYTVERKTPALLTMPAIVLNLGVVRGVELVMDTRSVMTLEPVPGEAPVRAADTDIFAKTIVKKGSLQGEEGLSVATEFGPLLPNPRGEPGVGGSANLIVSQKWRRLTLHLNNEGVFTRAHTWDMFNGAIVELSSAAPVRPVAEAFVEHDFNETATTYSMLLGAIWQTSEELNLDAGVRGAIEDGRELGEVRLGLTWTTPVWRMPASYSEPPEVQKDVAHLDSYLAEGAKASASSGEKDRTHEL
jgi:hypothetical protein